MMRSPWKCILAAMIVSRDVTRSINCWRCRINWIYSTKHNIARKAKNPDCVWSVNVLASYFQNHTIETKWWTNRIQPKLIWIRLIGNIFIHFGCDEFDSIGKQPRTRRWNLAVLKTSIFVDELSQFSIKMSCHFHQKNTNCNTHWSHPLNKANCCQPAAWHAVLYNIFI